MLMLGFMKVSYEQAHEFSATSLFASDAVLATYQFVNASTEALASLKMIILLQA
jgi:hypothetical protein